MKMISPPGKLLAEVAEQLLESARTLGHPADVVATTSGAEFGYGFTVPDDVFEHWFLARGEAKATLVEDPAEPEVLDVPLATVIVEPKKRGRGVKAATDETGA